MNYTFVKQNKRIMILEAFKSNDNFTRTTQYDCISAAHNFYSEGKNALKELKQYAKDKGFTAIIVHTNKSEKLYKL
jgi:hypothetical protein